MGVPAAGWYPDPAGSGGRRYWNGSAWTDHVAPAPEVAASAGSMASAEGAEASQPVPPAAPTASPEDSVTPPAAGPPPPAPPRQVPAPAPYPQPYPAAPTWGTRVAQMPAAAMLRLGPDGQVLSGWWRRFFGYFIDGILISIVTFIVVAVVAGLTGGLDRLVDVSVWQEWLAKVEANPNYQPTNAEVERMLQGMLPLFLWVTGGSLLLSFVNGVVLVNQSGQTVGDRMVGNRKVVVGRRPPGFGAALVRWIIPGVLSLFSWIVPLIGQIPWLLDYLWPLWDKQRQTWHDKAASTYVENSNMAGPLNR